MQLPPVPISRRRWLALAGVSPSVLKAAQTVPEKPLLFTGKRPMLVHNDYPEDLESPPEYFDTWITPNDAFFVRQHLPRPRVSADSYRLEIGGMVTRKVVLTLDDLKKMPRHRVPATLECAGNGRSYYRPKLPGLQWTKGAIGNAEWAGPRLKDVLEKAGVPQAAAFADFDGADTGVGQTPDFVRSIPMRKIVDEATIVALEMNGEPLPDLHGYPARLIVPGWDGASWVKWLSRITLSDKPDGGFYMNPAYRMPKHPVAPGTAAQPEDLEILEGMAVKSFFTRPADRDKVPAGGAILGGVAWAGEHRVLRVDLSTDGGSRWQPAEMGREDYRFSWRTWRFAWKPSRPGFHILCCRAADSAGRTQPIEPAWNPSGYLWNGIERIGLTVEGS